MSGTAPHDDVDEPACGEPARRATRGGWRRHAVRAVAVAAGLFLALQAVPYGWHHPNPPVGAEPAWPSDRARQLADASCSACHSNETNWPVYAFVAPMSWLVRRDVEAGRDELNFSEWDEGGDAGDAADAVADGSMPPRRYTLLHPSARLSDAERAELAAAFEAMDEADDGNEGPGGDDDGSGRGRGRGRGGDDADGS